MTYIKSIPIIVLIGIFISCSKYEGNYKNDAVKIEIQNNDPNEFNYTQIIDSVEITQLETNENSIIGGILKIVFKHQKVFILDRNHNLLIFEESGKFFSKLNKRGKGPGEYIELRDFFITEDGNILILTWKKILTYNIHLECIDEFIFNIKTDTGRELNPIFFMPFKQNYYFFMGSFGMTNVSTEKEMALFCINRQKKILKQFFPVEYNSSHLHRMFYNSNNKVYYTNGYGNDTIYEIKNIEVQPIFIIDFKNKKINKYDMMGGDRAKLFNSIWEEELQGNISNIFESDEYLCFKFSHGRTIKQVVFNKKSKNHKVVNVRKSLPFPAIVVAGVVDNSFFSIVEPYMILQMNSDHIYDELISNCEIKETDNPLIFKYKFKNIK